MIVDLFASVFFGILNAVFGLIPAFTLYEGPLGATGGAPGEHEFWIQNTLVPWLKVWDLFLPVGLMVSLLLVVSGTKVFTVGVQFVRWVWDRLPLKGT